MKIGEKSIKEILVLSEDNEVLCDITDQDIIEKNNIRVVCVPNESV